MSRVKNKMINQTKLITMSEYARLKGLTPGRITQLVQAGELPYVQVKGAKLIYMY